MMRATPALALLLLATAPLVSAEARDPAQVREFRAAHPCPATGRTRGPCRGYEVDHVTPLCAGGADRGFNLQWLTIEAHRLKTRDDVRRCAAFRGRP